MDNICLVSGLYRQNDQMALNDRGQDHAPSQRALGRINPRLFNAGPGLKPGFNDFRV